MTEIDIVLGYGILIGVVCLLMYAEVHDLVWWE